MKLKDNRSAYAAFALIAAGAAMRIFGAWCFAKAHTADHGIICLMVKHILEGRELPVFFYGMPYMGAIEPYTSVVLCGLFGMTDFMINMGTALFGILLLPVVYLWGRDAAGKTAGLAALAFCVVGPEFYFQFQSWADGGYAAITLLDALILWLGMRILNRARSEGCVSLRDHLLLGLLAGVCWFQSPLTISAFLTLAVIYLAVLRLKVFSWRLLWAGISFILGSLPLWLWNLRNGWQTFDMLETHGRPSFLHGLKLYYVDRMIKLLDLDRIHPFVFWLIAAIYIAAAAICLGYLLNKLARRGMRNGHYHLLAAIIFIAISSILFTRSHLALAPAVRYLVPIVPPIAVIIGSATALLSRRVPWKLAWLGVIVLVAYQSAMLPKRYRERLQCEAFAARAGRFADFLEAEDVEHVYTMYQVPWANHGLNFMLGERFVFSSLRRERYRPYAVAIENAARPAVLNNLAGFSSFLHTSGGSAKTGGMEGLSLQYNIKPPHRRLREISPGRISAITDGRGRPLLALLTDADLATAPDLNASGNRSASLFVKLDSLQTLSALRLRLPANNLPMRISISARAAGGDWREIKRSEHVTAYFWSGPRFFWGGDSYRLELDLGVERADELKIDVGFASPSHPCPLAELQLFAPAGSARTETSQAGLEAMLKERDIEEVYADRWLSNRLRRTFEGSVRVVESLLYRDGLPRRISLKPNTALIVARHDAELASRALQRAGIEMSRVDLGRWNIFWFEQGDWKESYAGYPGLYWAGYSPLLLGDKLLAAHYGRAAENALAAGDEAEAVRLTARALKIYPSYQPGMLLMAMLLEDIGRAAEAREYRRRYEQSRQPAVDCLVKFGNGIEFLGASLARNSHRIPSAKSYEKWGLEPATILPGESVLLRYYWRVPEEIDPEMLAVFVHFKADGELLFQDDHVLLRGAETNPQPFDEVFVEERRLRIPENTPPGRLIVDMGIYERTGSGMRIGFRSKTESGGFRSFRLPVNIIVGAGD